MSNVETAPDEVVCGEEPGEAAVEILTPRAVPLGGPRAMTVRRTLPQRQRSPIGAWCFLDHYGPDLPSTGPASRAARRAAGSGRGADGAARGAADDHLRRPGDHRPTA